MATSWLLAAHAHAHPLQLAVARLVERPGHRTDVSFEYSGTEDDPLDGRLVLSARCHTIGEPSHVRRASSISSRWSVRCGAAGLDGVVVTLEGAPGVQLVVDVTREDGSRLRQIVVDRPARFVVPPRGQPESVLPRYVMLGIEHILAGVDHLLFVLCLLLLHRIDERRNALRVLGTVTAFTLGHSVTLALAALDVVRVSPPPVEAVIALSIVLLAAELARVRAPGTPLTFTRRAPWLVASAFGLLHGMGFAGALREVGLPHGHVPLALLGFNVGVEIGQLAFVAACLVGWKLAQRWIARAPSWTDRFAPYAIGTVATYWFVQRIAAFWDGAP